MLLFPPLTTENIALVVLLCPPPTKLPAPLAVFFAPPTIEEIRPVAWLFAFVQYRVWVPLWVPDSVTGRPPWLAESRNSYGDTISVT